jgi:hypothetical protein
MSTAAMERHRGYKAPGGFNGFTVAQLFPPNKVKIPIKIKYQNPIQQYNKNII